MIIKRPEENLIPEYYRNYYRLCNEDNLLKELSQQGEATKALIETTPENKGDFAYAAGKWTIKEVLSHLIDSERVFAYRALRFSRMDNTPLHGFNENDFARKCNASVRTLNGLLREFSFVRASTIELFEFMSDEMLDFQGTANEVQLSARATGWITAGHNIHHLNVLRRLYL